MSQGKVRMGCFRVRTSSRVGFSAIFDGASQKEDTQFSIPDCLDALSSLPMP